MYKAPSLNSPLSNILKRHTLPQALDTSTIYS